MEQNDKIELQVFCNERHACISTYNNVKFNIEKIYSNVIEFSIFDIQNCQASLAMQHVYIVHQRVVNPMEQLLPTIVYEANTNWVILIHIL